MTMPQLPPGAGAAELQRLLQQGCLILDGQVTRFDAAASTGVQVARHGLGRVYRGAFVVYQDQPVLVYALDPVLQEAPQTYVYFQLSAATATRGALWCF